MKFYDTKNALETKRIESEYQKASLLPADSYEIYSRTLENTKAFGLSASKSWNAMDDYSKANEEIKNKFGVDLPNPLTDMITNVPGLDYTPTVFFQDYKKNIDWWNNEVQKLQENNPETEFKSFQQFQDERAAQYREDEFLLNEKQRAARTFMQKYGASFSAAFVGYMQDPLVLASLPLSAAYSIPKNFGLAALKIGLFEGGLEAGRQAMIETQVQPYRKELEMSYGTQQALTNIFGAAIGGAVLGPTAFAGFKGIGAGARATGRGFLSAKDLVNMKLFPENFLGKKLNKLVSQTDLDTPLDEVFKKAKTQTLLDTFDDLPKNITSKEKYQDIIYKTKQAVLESEQNPYANTVEGERLHDKNFKKAYNQVEKDEPIDIVDESNVELKKPDIVKTINTEEGKLAGLEEVYESLPDTKEILPQKKKLKTQINKAKKEIKSLKKQLAEKFPDPTLPPSLITPEEPKTQTFLQWLSKNKIKSNDGNIGDVKSILDKSTFRYTKKDGFSLDELLTRAREDGWLPPKSDGVDNLSINDVLDLISENPVNPKDQTKIAEFDATIQGIQQTIDELESAGIDPVGMTDDQVTQALQKLENNVDQKDLVKFRDEDYIDEFADDSFNDYMDFIEENKIPGKTELVLEVAEDGTPSKTTTAKQLADELAQEKRMIDELAKCEGLDL